MKVDVTYIETPTQDVKVSYREAGRKGGLAKVPKGFSKVPKDKLKELSRQAALKRWGKNEAR